MKLLIFSLLIANTSIASTDMTCFYNFRNNSIKVERNLKAKVTNVFSKNNLKYKINIENVDKPSELDDYVTIENEKGHKITYSLTCQN